jgi:hypothetical protein
MTDILPRLAALTRKEDIERLSKDYAGRFGWVSTTGPGFRLAHEDDMARGIAAAISESNAALIALVKEAAGEIDRLRSVEVSIDAEGNRQQLAAHGTECSRSQAEGAHILTGAWEMTVGTIWWK